MIEMIRQTEDTIKLPKNIRQIGNPASNWKIYVEDYVYTYLHPAAEQERAEKKVCVLFGKVHRAEKNYIFISGAVAVEPILKTVGLPEFTEEAWEYVYQQAKEYVSDFEIVGWSFTADTSDEIASFLTLSFAFIAAIISFCNVSICIIALPPEKQSITIIRQFPFLTRAGEKIKMRESICLLFFRKGFLSWKLMNTSHTPFPLSSMRLRAS